MSDLLPVFQGQTEIRVITAPEPSKTKTHHFADGGTQSYETGTKPGSYRATYSNISDEQLAQVRAFFEAHRSPELWRCVFQEGVLENCYFTPEQRFPGVIKHASGGHLVDFVFWRRLK